MDVAKAPEVAGKATVKAAVGATKVVFGFLKGVGKQTIKSLTKGDRHGK